MHVLVQVSHIVFNGANMASYSPASTLFYYPGQSTSVILNVAGDSLSSLPSGTQNTGDIWLADVVVWGSRSDQKVPLNVYSEHDEAFQAGFGCNTHARCSLYGPNRDAPKHVTAA